MYTEGLLKFVDPPCNSYSEDIDGYADCDDAFTDGHIHQINDSRANKFWKAPCVYLPHSCDNWVIGGAEQIKLLIADLQEALSSLHQD